MKRRMPRYPIYVPSKGRHERCYTAKFLDADGVPFRLVVEPQEGKAYASRFGEQRVLVLPFRDKGSVIPARNWIKEHSEAEGHERHWQLDDNIFRTRRWFKGKRVPCRSGAVLALTEDFVERYENVAVAGLNYTMFCVGQNSTPMPPFYLNVRVYSCTLTLNSLPYRWRGRYNEDADYCLQVLAGGWCTILMNAFLVEKQGTMKNPGGNTKELYQGDGRLKMARSLERMWPHVVGIHRRFNRPQHLVRDHWKRFDTALIPREGLDAEGMPVTDEHGMFPRAVREVRSDKVRRMLEET